MAHRGGPLRLLGVIGFAVTVAACSAQGPAASPSDGGGSPSAAPSREPTVTELTAYDAGAPLDLREESPPRSDEAGIRVHDVSWASPGGGRVSAWLVVPPGSGPFAGLVYLHGSETDRNDFLDEAVAMAHGGAVSIVMDAPFARAGDSRRAYLLQIGRPLLERDMNAQTIVDLRRAYDLLVARGDVDAGRLGFVGHSWGASAGGVLAFVDPRPNALVLISGRPSWTGFMRDSTDDWVNALRSVYGDEKWATYLKLLAPFDMLPVIGEIDPARLYLQYGRLDDVVPPDVSAQLLAAAPGAKADLYASGHDLDASATADRVAWLVDRLGLQPIGSDIIDTVGLPDA